MEKTISIRNTEITFSVSLVLQATLTCRYGILEDRGNSCQCSPWCQTMRLRSSSCLTLLGRQRSTVSRSGIDRLEVSTRWGVDDGQADKQTAIPVLVGTKYDMFASFPHEEQEEITKQAKRFSKAMHAPLVSMLRGLSLIQKIFCSTAQAINVQKIFKIVLAKAFDLKVSCNTVMS